MYMQTSGEKSELESLEARIQLGAIFGEAK